jgi:alkaline phosphatase
LLGSRKADKLHSGSESGQEQISIAEFWKKAFNYSIIPGFFIMVENSKINWACHANDAATSS